MYNSIKRGQFRIFKCWFCFGIIQCIFILSNDASGKGLQKKKMEERTYYVRVAEDGERDFDFAVCDGVKSHGWSEVRYGIHA